jgi:RecA/RadA recombinase
MSETEQIREALLRKRPPMKPQAKDFVSTGSTLLNLALTDDPFRGFAAGHYYHTVGDSSAGKTWILLSAAAEMCANPQFDEFDIYRDDTEGGGALMDISHFFGKKLEARLKEPPNGTSSTAEEFYRNMDDVLQIAQETGRGFIYQLDSQDGLDSEAAEKKFDEQKKAVEKGKEAKGSYGDGKAKLHSANMRRVTADLPKTNGLLLVTSQTREDPTALWDPKTYSGGKALRFYATAQIWLAVKEQLFRTVNERKRQVGVASLFRTRKNRHTGKDRQVEVPIYHSFGIDDVGSCVNYLLDEKHWEEKKNTVVAKDFKFEGTFGKLVRHIEENSLQRDLADIVGDVWKEIESKLAIERKSRYE